MTVEYEGTLLSNDSKVRQLRSDNLQLQNLLATARKELVAYQLMYDKKVEGYESQISTLKIALKRARGYQNKREHKRVRIHEVETKPQGQGYAFPEESVGIS